MALRNGKITWEVTAKTGTGMLDTATFDNREQAWGNYRMKTKIYHWVILNEVQHQEIVITRAATEEVMNGGQELNERQR